MMTIFSQKLSELRKTHKVTQEQLAQHLGVSAQAVSKWENGSYPDGDLLPKIADFFGVSIDYLYGRDCGKVSVEQQVLDELKVFIEKGEYRKYREKEQQYLWAMQIASWISSRTFYDYHCIGKDENAETASLILDDAGFSYMRLNESLEYYMMMKEPENGFASYFQVTDELAKLFRLLGDKDHLKILFYMLGLNATEAVRIPTLEKRLGIPAEKVKKVLEYFCECGFSGQKMFYKGKVLDEQDHEEAFYCADKVRTVSLLMLFAGADAVLHQPTEYQVQVCSRGKSLFQREDPEFLR